MDVGETKSIAQAELRLILVGKRWAGKSMSGNTILRKERFECGRTRTAQCEVRHEEVEGRRLVVVDAPGWGDALSLTEIPEGDKRRFKLTASKCPPGPHAFLLVVPIDTAFSTEQRRTVEAHMKLLGSRVWRHTMVLFTCEDFLGGKTIEQHVESEGDALRWLMGMCDNRYHVFNNKDPSNWAQVAALLEKTDALVRSNGGGYYELDEQVIDIIREKQRGVTQRAETRRRAAEEQAQRVKGLIPGMTPIRSLQLVLLGSRGVGKTSLSNAILGIKAGDSWKRTTRSAAQRGCVGETEVTVVDTPGWWKGFSAPDTPEAVRDELRCSVFLSRPGPHVFLLVLDADASFNANHLEAVTTHVELLGKDVWRHTVVVFTRGDRLGAQTIEEFIEGEGEALRSLIDCCGNRYHVTENRNAEDGTQLTELLEKITGIVAENGSGCFTPDEQMLRSIEERRRRVEERAGRRENEVKTKRQSLRGCRNTLEELRIIMLGHKTSGKSATGNNLLRKEVFATCENERCHVQEAQVGGRRIRVVDTPGWCVEESKDLDKEIARGLLLSPSGLHVVLLVVPLDLTLRDAEQMALEEHMNLFGSSIWAHTMVLFTYGDKLVDKSVEEHIEREQALRRLVDRCDNQYHVMNNTKRSDVGQVTELIEKIEEVVAGNKGQVFCPDVYDIHLRIEEKFKRSRLKRVLKPRLIEEYRRRELELMVGFKTTLLELQAEIRGGKSMDGDKAKRSFGHRKKDPKLKEQNIDAKISQEILKLEEKITTSHECLGRSMEFLLPDFSSESRDSASDFDKVLSWLSKLHIDTNVQNQLTLNFSQSSGYGSRLPLHADRSQGSDD